VKDKKNHLQVDDDALLQKNRIHDLHPDAKTGKMGRSGQIILISVISFLLIAVIISVIIFYKKPAIFTPLKKISQQYETTINETPSETKNARLQRGRESYERKYYTDAISEFNNVIESDAPDSEKAIALMYLGMISDDRGNQAQAIDYFTRALVYDKKNADILRNMALAYRHKKDFDSAIAAASRGLDIKPDDVNTLILLGNIYFELSKYDKSADHYRKALEISPDNPQVLFNLGSALLNAGDEFAAIEYFKKAGAADRIGEVAARSYSRLGTHYLERGRTDLAEKYLREAAAIKPDDASVRYNLGILYLRQKRKDMALAEFEKSETLAHEDAMLLENLGEAYSSLKEYDKSLDVYNRLLRVNTRNVRVLSKIAEIYHEKGDLDRAIDGYRKITEIEPGTENARIAWLNMGNVLDDAGKYTEAIEAYEKALVISPKDDSAYYNLGLAYKHAKRPEEAVRAWQRASALNEKNPGPRLAIADYYYDSGLTDLAENEYRKISELWPSIQEPHFKIGYIYYRKEKYDYALRAFEKVVELNGSNDMARRAYIPMAVITARTARGEEDFEKAMNMIQKALMIKPGDTDSLFSLGIIYSKKEMYSKAIDTFYQVIKGTGDSSVIAESYNNIGICYYNKKQYRKALQAFTRGIDEDPANEEIRINRKAAMQAYETELAEEK